MHRPDFRRHQLLIAILFLLAVPIALVYAEQKTDVDLLLADLMFDPATQSFPWRHAWLTETLMHNALRRVFMVLACIPVMLCLRDLVWSKSSWTGWFRTRMQTVALSAVIIPLTVSTLKQLSASHCPWDIGRYGGMNSYVRLLEALPAGASHGQCLPAGHASGALWLISIAVFWWPHKPRVAALVGLTMLSAGFGVGWVQQMRGAHFLSHTLWSMWIACVIVPCLFVVLDRIYRAKFNLPHVMPNEIKAAPVKVKNG